MSKRHTIAVKKVPQRKLSGLLAVVLCAWLQIIPALAAVDNTVTVNATNQINGQPVTSQANETIDVEDAAPAITLNKVGTPNFGIVAPAGVPNVGDTISYTFTVKNTGNITLDNVTVTDPGLTLVGGAIGTLAPNATAVATATYTITQPDINAGVFNNTAEVAADPRDGSPQLTVPDTESVVLPSTSGLTLVKNGTLNLGGDGIATPGDIITYTFDVENTGTVSINNVTLSDPSVAVAGGPILSLLPGATDSTTFSATHAITQADIDAGTYANTATVSGSLSGGGTAQATDNVNVTIPRVTPGLLLTKTGVIDLGVDGVATAGDIITYSFAIENIGNVTLNAVTLTDPQATVSGTPIASLAPGVTNTTAYSATYAITLADIAAGNFVNTATVTGNVPSGGTESDSDSETVPLTAQPSLSLTKTGTVNVGVNGRPDAGETITYAFAVKNTGNVPLTNVVVTDPLVTVSGAAIATLAPGATNSTAFTAIYVLTQADIDAGTFANTADVTGTPPSGPDVTAQGSVTKPVARVPAITLAKTGTANFGVNGVPNPGDVINYTLAVTNTGNVTLDNVTVTDPGIVVVGGSLGTLAPGDTGSALASHVLTQADIDAGTFSNTAQVAGDPPTGAAVTASDTENVALPAPPAITLDKIGSLDLGGNGVPNPGDVITYSFRVENTGLATLTNVTLIDPQATVSGGPIASLLPGDVDTTTFTATHAITQAEIDAGSFVNTAQVRGNKGATLVTATDSFTTPIVAASSLTLDKTATPNFNVSGVNGRADPGDRIAYQFVVTNTGQTTLTNVTISDPLVAQQQGPSETAIAALDAARAGSDPIVTSTTSAAPSQRVAQQAQRVPDIYSNMAVTRRLVLLSGKADELLPGDRVGILHEVINTGYAPLVGVVMQQQGGEVFTDSIGYLAPGAVDDASLLIVHELTLDEIVSGNVSAPSSISAKARDKVITANLSSAMSLAQIETYDAFAAATITPTNVVSLAPGASTTFAATYILTQADIDAGARANSATATGRIGSGPGTVTANDSENVPLPAQPGVAVVKSFTSNFGAGGIPNVGETLTYTFTVTNTGNVSLTSVGLADPLIATIPRISGDANNNNRLDFGETWIYRANYALTQDDIDAGNVTNQATVSGTPPVGLPVIDLSDESSPTGNDPTIAPLTPQPVIAIVKTAGPIVDVNANSLDDPGDTIAYTFTVTNPGNVSLASVGVTDAPLALAVPPVPITYQSGDADSDTELDPNETWIFGAVYPLDQDDINNGQVVNRATASGTPPVGAVVTDQSHPTSSSQNGDTTVPVQQVRSVAVLKVQNSTPDGNNNGLWELGETISYDITVTNTGTVTITSGSLTDANASLSANTYGPLNPGDTTAVITATHLITAADVAARQVLNTAVATGSTGTSGSVRDDSDYDPAVYLLPANNRPTRTPISELRIGLVKPSPTNFTDVNTNGAMDAGDLLKYTFSVVNRGTEPLSNISIADDPLQALGVAITYVRGDNNSNSLLDLTETWEYEADYPITAQNMIDGFVDNQAIVSSQGPNGTPVNDRSDNNSPDENDVTRTLVGTPKIGLVKTSSGIRDVNNNGVNDAGDIIDYSFTVTNTGGIPLTNIVVTDSKVGAITGSPVASLAVGASNVTPLTASYTIRQADVNRGYVDNQAKASANSIRGPVTDLSDDSSVSENDRTRTPLSQAPGIALIKTITSITDTNGNGVNDPGDVINYQFAVTNTGNVTLTGVTITDVNAVVTGGPIASLAPGATNSTTIKATHRVTGVDASDGKVTNSAVAQGNAPGNVAVSDVSDNKSLNGNAPTVVKVFQAPPTITKTAGRSEILRGESVVYTITANGLTGLRTAIRDIMPGSFIYVDGSATANGRAITPKQDGRVLTFTGYKVDVDGRVEIKLKLIAGTTLSSGKFINTAQVVNRDNGAVIASATAAVEIKPEHVFDCGDVIGRVFNDLNGNGYPDDGDPGLPSVNVVTVNGLIITSDAQGRFHVACADIPNYGIGSNFLLKLDLTTLPTGYVLTSENPRDVRLTRGKVTKLNFGAKRSCDVRLDLRKDAFVTDSVRLKPNWTEGLGRLSRVLQQCPGKLEVVYTCGKPHPIIEGRLQSIETAIRERWDADGAPYDLNISSRSECEK